ncbi:MAG: branched-chain alpha-keto acid dehydrogenase subunit E2, partial [Nitrosospira sp.]|nr:branched-chain alpha-keto acid dehydrogenase subunit E2 [Nitrosospira sp.]
MAETKQVLVPDIGDFKDVPVIELLVKPGDTVRMEDPLISLESDKATIEVPSPLDGVIKEISVKLGDKVSQGSLILTVEVSTATHASSGSVTETPTPSVTPTPVS